MCDRTFLVYFNRCVDKSLKKSDKVERQPWKSLLHLENGQLLEL